MDRLPDLVRDLKLETHFIPGDIVETVHTYHEPDPISRQRLGSRSEHWQRQRRIGDGGFGSMWLEKCTKGHRDIQVRAVKRMEISAHVEYNRELDAIAKFSHRLPFIARLLTTRQYERCFVKSFGWYESPVRKSRTSIYRDGIPRAW